jgi:hypothetical protein
MRGAIRGYQKPSEAFRGHQRPSEAIRGPIHGLSGALSVPQGGSVPMMREAISMPLEMQSVPRGGERAYDGSVPDEGRHQRLSEAIKGGACL